jgi:hypothetical protein
MPISQVPFAGISNPVGFRNALINGDYSIAQRGTSFASGANNDDAYTLDRWYILSDGNDAIDVTQETSVVPTNQLTAIALDVETTNKKFGIAQIIEQKNCVGLIGNTVTLSFQAKVSATTKLDNVKCAIVAWSGTADTVTSDIISAWGAEGTNPTLIANATYENSPANLNVTTSYAKYVVSAAVDTSSTKNIIVFIWSDVTDTTAGDFLYITDVQLEPGSQASGFEFMPIDVSLGRCQRYFQRWDSSESVFLQFIPVTYSYNVGGNNWAFGTYFFPETMRSAPTITSSAAATFATAFSVFTISSIKDLVGYKKLAEISFNTGASTLGFTGIVAANNTASAFLNFSSEL